MKCEKCDIKLNDKDTVSNTMGIHCRTCWMKISGGMNLGEWVTFMNREHPNSERAWND